MTNFQNMLGMQTQKQLLKFASRSAIRGKMAYLKMRWAILTSQVQ